MGFLGGISWALLVARICQLYPTALPSTLISRFFRVYEHWKWPNPVMLNAITDGNLGLKVWNPKIYPKDRTHLMPIITPAYPAMNSTYNVSNSTLMLMKQEFARGANVTMKIESEGAPWSLLFERDDFFLRYKAYVQVDMIATDEEDHRKWQGWIESRLRFLVLNLEQTPNLQFAHPYPSSFPLEVKSWTIREDETGQESTKKEYGSCFFIGLGLNLSKSTGTTPTGPKTIDLTPAVTDFTQAVKEWPIKSNSMDLRIKYVKR